MKQKPRTHLRAVLAEWGIITLGTAIVAAAVFFFLVPSKLSVGSVSGLAIVLANVIPLPVSAITMALNVLFLVLGFLLIGGEFGAKTVYTSILLPLVLGILSYPGEHRALQKEAQGGLHMVDTQMGQFQNNSSFYAGGAVPPVLIFHSSCQ